MTPFGKTCVTCKRPLAIRTDHRCACCGLTWDISKRKFKKLLHRLFPEEQA